MTKEKPLFEPFKGYNSATLETFSSTTVGNLNLEVKDFSKIKCPFCQEDMVVSGIDHFVDSSYDDGYQRDVMNRFTSIDGGGIAHMRCFGRPVNKESHNVILSCRNNCIKEMIVNASNISVGAYQEFPELQQHRKVK